MKFSPDGKHLALVIGNQLPNMVEWYDFDQASGKLSNYRSAAISVASGSGYGVEFSPGNQLLYASDGDSLVQFNLERGDGNKDSVASSKKIILGTAGSHIYGMQMGPDNKIYVCTGDTTLAVIEQPDSVGASVKFILPGRFRLTAEPVYLTCPILLQDTIMVTKCLSVIC